MSSAKKQIFILLHWPWWQKKTKYSIYNFSEWLPHKTSYNNCVHWFDIQCNWDNSISDSQSSQNQQTVRNTDTTKITLALLPVPKITAANLTAICIETYTKTAGKTKHEERYNLFRHVSISQCKILYHLSTYNLTNFTAFHKPCGTHKIWWQKSVFQNGMFLTTLSMYKNNYTVHSLHGNVTSEGECKENRLPWPSGVWWWLKKELLPVDVFSTQGHQSPLTEWTFPPVHSSYPSWNVLSLHFSSFTAVPSPVWEGHGGTVLNRIYEEYCGQVCDLTQVRHVERWPVIETLLSFSFTFQ